MGAAIAPLAIASAVAGVAGAGISAAGQYSAMEAQSQNAAYQAQVAANNAAVAQKNAGLDFAAGAQKVGQQELKTRAEVGSTKASQGASGVNVNAGSFVKARGAEAEIGALDALTIRSNTAKQAYGQQVAATSDTAESQLLTTESQQAANAAPMAAFGSFLGSASSVGGSYAKYLQSAG